MKLTIEELRKVYDNAEEMHFRRHGFAFQKIQAMDSALLAVARFVAERQRAVEPTEEMLRAGALRLIAIGPIGGTSDHRADEAYRAMSAVAPLVVPE